MSGPCPGEPGEGYLLLVVSLPGTAPSPAPALLVEQQTEQGALSIRHRPDGAIQCRVEFPLTDGRPARLSATSCPLVGGGPCLCVAEVKWQAPDLLEVCLNGTLIASSDRARALPRLYRLPPGEARER